MSSIPLAYRPYAPTSDLPWVFASWLGSARWNDVVPAHLQTSIRKAAVHQLLKRGMQIVLAVNPDDPDQFIGFIAFEPGLLHYVFVKDLFRRQGVASSLMAYADFDRSDTVVHTFYTPAARHLARVMRCKPGLAAGPEPYARP